MKNVVIFCLCLLAGGSSVLGQEKKSCLTEEVFTEAIGCITKKFEAILNDTQDGTYMYSSNRQGRHLQSIDGIGVPRVGSQTKAIKKFSDLHNEIFKDLAGGMIYLKQSFGEDFDILQAAQVLRTISKIDVDKIRTVYGEMIIHELMDYKEAMTRRARQYMLYSKNAGSQPQGILDDLCKLFPDLQVICDVLNCFEKYNDSQLEDGLDWIECLYECDDLPDIAQCVNDTFTDCKDEGLLGNPSWISNLVVKGFADFAKLDQCYIKLLSPEQVRLQEGGSTDLVFKTYLPPTMQCYDLSRLDTPMGVMGLLVGYLSRNDGEKWCFPEIQISTSNYIQDIIPFLPEALGSPKCRNDKLMEQAVLGWHENAVNSSCTIIITDTNWNDTFTIPVTGVVDGKIDKDYENTTLTMKMVVNGAARYSRKLTMVVEDKDPNVPLTCRSVSDPHIVTFDGLYYNNHFEGHFQLYKHNKYPYQVQAIYQKCGDIGNGTCNCAVAVQSGDDVIVVDKCQRTSLPCSAPSCVPPTKIKVYLNGNLTSGTRLFRRNDGLGFDVLLPHGTYVQVTEVSGSLNAFIRPSVYDRGNTLGLCGTFNANTADDLTLPDGSLYDRNTSSEVGSQPKGFSDAWRVAAQEAIFEGVLADGNWTGAGNFCTCHHVLLSGVQCECGPTTLVEPCDIILGEEITHNVSIIASRSWRQVQHDNPAQKIPDDDVTIDYSHDLTEISWRVNGSDTKQSATDYCTSLLTGDRYLEKCADLSGMDKNFMQPYIQGCVEDIQMLDSRAYGWSAMQAARGYCQEWMDQRYRWTDDMITAFTDLDCPSSCYGKGTCSKGTCQCNTNSTGPACGQTVDAIPKLISTGVDLCDNRNFNCSYAHVYGMNFLPEYTMQCHITPIEVTESGVKEIGSGWKVDVIRITPGQLACPLNTQGSYKLSLVYSKANIYNEAVGEEFTSTSTDFIKFDSVCFTCDVTKKTCSERTDGNHCLINGDCLAAGETDPNDSCNVCDPTKSSRQYQYKQDDVCKKRLDDENAKVNERNIRIIISCVLSAVVILAAIILFICQRRNKSDESQKTAFVNRGLEDQETKVPETHTTSFTTTHSNECTEVIPEPDQKVAAQIGQTTQSSQNGEPYSQVYHTVNGPEQLASSPSTREIADFVRLKEAAMSNTRARSLSTGSRKSLGIGGAGPVAFAMHAAEGMSVEPPAVEQPAPTRTSQMMGETEFTNVRF